MESRYLDETAGKRVVFFTGKGGVGKSTVAWATALALHRRGLRVRYAAWAPFEDTPVVPPKGIADLRFPVQSLETLGAFREYALRILKFATLYDTVFDNRILRTFLLASPGLSETVIAGKIMDLVERREQDVLLVDLPASGHAESFFRSSNGIRKIFPAGFVHRQATRIVEMYAAPWCRVDLVALPEELPMRECHELRDRLEAAQPVHFGFLHVNQRAPFVRVPALAGPVGEDVARTLDRYRARLEREAEALRLAEPIGLPRLEIPEFTPSSGPVIDTMARYFGGEAA
jgi:hypothetical protein